jgi:hypothetical protein
MSISNHLESRIGKDCGFSILIRDRCRDAEDRFKMLLCYGKAQVLIRWPGIPSTPQQASFLVVSFPEFMPTAWHGNEALAGDLLSKQ